MSDYTAVNLISDVENMAPKFGMEGIEARFARTNLELEQSGLSVFILDPDARIPFGHRHSEQEEIYVLLEGSGTIQVGDEAIEVGPMDAVRVAPGVARGYAAGPQGARILAVGAPNTDNKDAEMVEDFWAG